MHLAGGLASEVYYTYVSCCWRQMVLVPESFISITHCVQARYTSRQHVKNVRAFHTIDPFFASVYTMVYVPIKVMRWQTLHWQYLI